MDGDLPSLRGSPTNPGMVTHQPKDRQPPEGVVLQTWNLALTLYSENYHLVTTAMDGHPPSLGGSPNNPKTVIPHPKDGHPPVVSVLHSWNLVFALYSQNLHQVTIAIDGLLPSLRWSPHPRMVTQCFFSVMLFSMVLAMLLTSGLRGVDFLVIPPLH